MESRPKHSDRRKFIQTSAFLSAGLLAAPLIGIALPKNEATPISAIPTPDPSDNIYMIGPQEGYSPQIGTLLSTMTMMREWVIGTVKELSVAQLDFQIDEQSNSIGAMLLHLAATEKYYQLNTFDGMAWGTWSKAIKEEWDVPSGLGKAGRKKIKGNAIDYYLSKLEEVRSVTKKEFAKRDDKWIMHSEPFFNNQPTNNYCKWFHVCEHESNHRGQMKFIIKRLTV